MDKNIDLRRTTAISTVNGLPRRNQRVASLRDSADDDKQMELKETLKIRDREQFKKKDRDRDFPKRRRVDYNRITHASDEEYFEEEEDETRTSQPRQGFRTHRSSPVLRDAVDEVLGVPIPRRARSASSKKLHEYQNSGSGDQKSIPSPDTGSPIGSGSASPLSSGASMKKKMKPVEPGTRVSSCALNSKPSSLIQNDIEIEVAEALFDLMTQSHSQSQPSNKESIIYRDGTNTADEELKRLKAERGKVESDAFKDRNEESVKANSETILFESMNNNKGGEKEKVRDEPAQESVRGDGFVDRGKVGSLKESESSPCVKRNACDIQDPTLTKANYAASVVEPNKKKESRAPIDLMELPSLPSSPDRDTLPDPKVTIRDVQKKSEITPKIGVSSDSQLPILNLDKKRRHNGISSVGDSTFQQPQGRKEPNIQSPASYLSFPIGMGGWPCVLPHPGYMSALGGRSSMTMQPPQFKFVKPRTKRCTTHRLVADNIHRHQQLVTKSLSSSSGPTTSAGVATLYGTKPLSLKSTVPIQRLATGKDKRSNVAAAAAAGADVNPTTGGNSMLLQQASNQAPSHNFVNSGFTLALGQHKPTMMAPANSSGGQPQSNSSRKITSNSFPEAQLTPVTYNQQVPLFPSNEAAASYMAMLQSSGHPIPVPTNMSLPSFKSGSSFLNSSYYSPPMFNIAQIQHPPSQKSQPSTGDNKHSPQREKNSINNAHAYSYHVGSNKQGGSKNKAELAPQHFPLPFNSNLPSMNQNSTIFQMLPELSWNGNNKASEGKSQTDSKSDNPFLASFYHHQQQMQQLLLKGGASSAAIQPDYLPFLPKWDNYPRATTAQEGSSHQSRGNGTQLKSFQGKNHNTTLDNTPSAQGHHPVAINSQPMVSSIIAGQRNNASAVPGLASQETEGSSQNGGSTPACRRVVPSILSTCTNQLSEIKYG